MGVLDAEYNSNFAARESKSMTNGTARNDRTVANFSSGDLSKVGGNIGGGGGNRSTTSGTAAREPSSISKAGGAVSNASAKSDSGTFAQVNRSLKGMFGGSPIDVASGSYRPFKTNIDITGSSLVPNQLNNTATSGLTKASSTGGPARYKSTTPVAGPKMKSGAQDYSSIVPGTVSFTDGKKTTTTTSTSFNKAYPKLAKYTGGTQAKPVMVTKELAKQLAKDVQSAGGFISRADFQASTQLPDAAKKDIGKTVAGNKTTTLGINAPFGTTTVDISYPGTIKQTTTKTQKLGTFNPTPTYGAMTGGRVRYTSSAPAPAAPKSLGQFKTNMPNMGSIASNVTSNVAAKSDRTSVSGSASSAQRTDRQPITVSNTSAKADREVTKQSVVDKTRSITPTTTSKQVTPKARPANITAARDAQTFSQAFSQARANLGAGQVFSYKGGQYSTNIAGETGRASGLKTKSSVARTTASKVKTGGGSSIAQRYITNFNSRKAK